jgi:hypothetical protein
MGLLKKYFVNLRDNLSVQNKDTQREETKISLIQKLQSIRISQIIIDQPN